MQAILRRLLEQSRSKSDDWRPSIEILRTAWPGLVGDRLDAVTEPESVDWERGALVVATASQTWRRELQRHDDALVERITAVLPWRLTSVEFTVGPLDPEDDAAAASAPPTDPDADPEEPAAPETPERIELPDDVESSLDSLERGAASSARRILGHLRDDPPEEGDPD